MPGSLKLLYIYTSGRLNSVYNKMWFDAFYGKDLDISIIIADESARRPENYHNYRFLFTDPHQILIKFPFVKAVKEFVRIRKFIRSVSPDIIHVQGCYYTFLITPLMIIKKRYKLIFNLWGNDYNTLFRKSVTHKVMIRWLIRKSDLIWLMWYEMADKVRNDFPAYASKIKTITWGIDSSLLTGSVSEKDRETITEKYNLTDTNYKLLYAKGFRASNNQHKLIEALAQVDPTLDFKVILHCAAAANDSTYEKLLMNLIEKYGFENRIILSHDYLTDAEMRALFEVSDLSFAISQEDQLTITIFESIIANTNLILNDIEPYRILKQVTKSDFDLVDVSDTKKFAQKIEDYIRYKKVPEWGKAMQFIKGEYLFDKKTDQYIQIYQNILKAE